MSEYVLFVFILPTDCGVAGVTDTLGFLGPNREGVVGFAAPSSAPV